MAEMSTDALPWRRFRFQALAKHGRKSSPVSVCRTSANKQSFSELQDLLNIKAAGLHESDISPEREKREPHRAAAVLLCADRGRRGSSDTDREDRKPLLGVCVLSWSSD